MIKWATMVWAILASSNLLAQAPEAEPAMGALAEAFEPITVEINEWTVPWPDTRPRDPDVAPNGSVWLVGQGTVHSLISTCLLYTSPSPRDKRQSRMPSSA